MVTLLGVGIENISRSAVLERMIKTPKPLFVVTLNPEILLCAWRDENYRKIINEADVKIVDGVGIVILAQLLYKVRLERFTGADLAEEILTLASKQGKRIFLLGGTKETNEKVIKEFRARPPKFSSKIWEGKGLAFRNIGGLGGGFNEKEAIEKINEFNPDILFVALGAPKQEIFIHNLLQTTNYKLQTIMVGIGGTIDFWAYPWLRAPKIVRRIGLEWLWRLVLQPWRLPRILKATIVFPIACLWEKTLLK